MYDEIIARVEGALKTLGIEAKEAKTGDGQYNISKDQKTEVLLDVWEDHDRTFLQVMSPVTKINDESRVEVLKMLLEENHGLVEASFTLLNGQIFVKETIECSAFFNQERAISTITRIAFYSEAYANKWAM
ncbi:MAG: hypothetical protein K0S32_1619 [Bacteroidetes bacterium]|jgi:hypothetical protein|nr:hypothetical protein [Bacteroidota bacterium]